MQLDIRLKDRVKNKYLKLCEHVTRHHSIYSQTYLVILLSVTAIYQLMTSIQMGDTDMWYHLNGGRFFWSHGEVADTPYFSFFHPDREWINYFWGFQILTFSIFDLAGYHGLIVLRTTLFIGTIFFIYKHLSFECHNKRLIVLSILSIYIILMLDRSLQVRPHLFSYLFIIIFLYVLEYRPKLSPILPVLALLWANLHGVEWVIGALICGAYVIDEVLRRFKYTNEAPRKNYYLTSVLLCIPAILINPHGFMLLATPFLTPDQSSNLIMELGSIWTTDSLASSSYVTWKHVTVLIAALSLFLPLASLWSGHLKARHLILLVGGFALLFKGERFVWEWSLLVLPLISHSISTTAIPAKNHPALQIILLSILLLPPMALLGKYSPATPYPFNHDRLPQSVTSFLKQNGGQGNILSTPSINGYVAWKLHPNFKIMADMELPPFTEIDIYKNTRALYSADILEHLNNQYGIDFIIASREDKDQKNSIKAHGDYAPIYFDYTYTLYAHKSVSLAHTHELTHFKPDNLYALNDSQISAQEVNELISLAKYDKNNLGVNIALAYRLFKLGQFEKARLYADTIANSHPHHPSGHFLIGNILENTNRCDNAIFYYLKALKNADEDTISAIDRHIGRCAYVNQDFQLAYDYLIRSVNPYNMHTAPEDLYLLAYSALVTGNTSEAATYLRILKINNKSGNMKLQKDANDLLNKIKSGLFESFTIKDWIINLVNNGSTNN